MSDLTTGQRFADAVTATVGSWRFIIWQAVIIVAWIWGNSDGIVHFDPQPFIMLNLLLSFEAAFTAPFLLMSANRQAEIDRRTLTDDLQLDAGTNEELRALRAQHDKLTQQHDEQSRLIAAIAKKVGADG